MYFIKSLAMMNLNTSYFLAYSQDDHFAAPLQREVNNLGFQHYKHSREWEECINFIQGNFPAIFICDIDDFLENGKENSLKQLKTIVESTPTIVVSSTLSKRNLNLLDFNPLINKPSLENNLLEAVNIALYLNQKGAAEAKVPTYEQPLKKIFFKIGNSLKSFEVNEIDYFYSEQKMNYAKINSRSLPTMIQLRHLEDKFYHHFVRIHRGYLANLDKIEELDFSENTVTVNGVILPLGEKFKKSILERIELIK